MQFNGRAGWIRKDAKGAVAACMPDGDSIAAFGTRIEGRGPWSYNMDGRGTVQIEGVPRKVNLLREKKADEPQADTRGK